MVVLASRQPFQRRGFPDLSLIAGTWPCELVAWPAAQLCENLHIFQCISRKVFQVLSAMQSELCRSGNYAEHCAANYAQRRSSSFFLIGTHVDLGQNYSSVGGEALKMKNASMREISGNILKREISLEIPECFDS
jgi:hypothetical protein